MNYDCANTLSSAPEPVYSLPTTLRTSASSLGTETSHEIRPVAQAARRLSQGSMRLRLFVSTQIGKPFQQASTSTSVHVIVVAITAHLVSRGMFFMETFESEIE